MKVKTPTRDGYIPLYAYAAGVNNEILWQTGQCFETEEEAIGYALSMVNVEYIHIVKVPGLQTHEIPNTLKSLRMSEAGVIDYGEASATEQHPGECDRPEPNAEDREIFSGT